MLDFEGARLAIRYCELRPFSADPATWEPPSLSDALKGCSEKKRNSVKAKLIARRNYLADGGQLRSPDHWNTEATLPDGKRFYAIKADDIRAYGWFSGRYAGAFYISHFARKKGRKLAAEDNRRVIANWQSIEEARR